MSELAKQLEQAMVSRRLARQGKRILVAVSGGLDSMVLLRVLSELAKAHNWKLVVAHFNHRLRGRSSDADERLVRATAKKLRLEFVTEAGDVRGFAREHGLSLEMAARKLRHEFLAKAAAERKIKTIALAHHADDQVELFFLRLLRGAGSEGLAGMKWQSPSPANGRINLVRPLLGQTKQDLRAYAKHTRTAFREDATNAQLDMQRNRIRAELIPLLVKHYQPALRRVILREMETLGAEAEFINREARDWLQKKRCRGDFEDLPAALQRHCLGAQLSELGVAASFGLIEELREAPDCPIMVSETTTIECDKAGRIQKREVGPNVFDLDRKCIRLSGEGQVFFAKTRISWNIRKHDSGTFRAARRGAKCEYFDAKKAGSAIILRHWRPGDRFQPIGMAKSVKLQDLFTNQKVPRADRHRRIVATTDSGEVFWVEGLRIAERFKLGVNTTHRLQWEWQRV